MSRTTKEQRDVWQAEVDAAVDTGAPSSDEVKIYALLHDLVDAITERDEAQLGNMKALEALKSIQQKFLTLKALEEDRNAAIAIAKHGQTEIRTQIRGKNDLSSKLGLAIEALEHVRVDWYSRILSDRDWLDEVLAKVRS